MLELIKKIRRQSKSFFDNISNERLKNNLLQAIPFWVASLLTGLVAVAYTKLFAYAESKRSLIFQHTSWLFFLITPACFIIAWW